MGKKNNGKAILKLTASQKTCCKSYALVICMFVLFSVLKSAGLLSSSIKGMLVPICAYIVMAISLNLTVGIMGELSLGHAGFMSVGAFVGTSFTMILSTSVPDTNLRLFLGMVVGAIAAAIMGFLIGIPVLRLKGDYLAIVTLAFGEIIKSFFSNTYLGVDEKGLHFQVLNSELGMSENGRIVIEGAMGIRSIPKISTFLAGFVLIMICLVVVFHFITSRTGRAVMAIRDNRIAAESVGIPAFRFKIVAFTLSAAMAGASGVLFANNYSSLIASKFGFDTSILVLVFVVLGGQGNMFGSIIAAAALTVLPEALRQFADYRMLTYAIVLILVMLISNNPVIKAWLDAKIGKLNIGKKKKAAKAAKEGK